VAFLHPIFQGVLLQLTAALDQRQPKPGGADIRFQAVLLEKHPLQRDGALDALPRLERGIGGEIPENRTGLR
jgi:hypothetical protein